MGSSTLWLCYSPEPCSHHMHLLVVEGTLSTGDTQNQSSYFTGKN